MQLLKVLDIFIRPIGPRNIHANILFVHYKMFL